MTLKNQNMWTAVLFPIGTAGLSQCGSHTRALFWALGSFCSV